MNQLRPGQIAGLIGSVLLLISAFVDWASWGPFSIGVLDGDGFGFTGVFVLLIALALLAIAVIRAFAPQISLPEQVIGFSLDQMVMSLAFAVLIYGLSVSFLSQSGTNLAAAGTFLAWIGGAAVIAGVIIDQRMPTAPTGDDPPPPAG